MRVAIASDHAGFELKRELSEYLRQSGHEVTDLGNHSYDPADDYPDYAEAIGDALRAEEAERGVLICGSGIGASVAANKLPGIRAGLAHDTYSAHQGVEHDNMNLLVLGSRVIGPALARDLVQAFLAARFSGEDRHVRRLAKVRAIEARYTREPTGEGERP